MALDQDQLRNAAIIYQVGRQLGASHRDIKIALIAAMQESGLRNLHYGDRDSQGLFQQRPSMGWGSVQQVTDPRYAARAFFQGAGTNPGLLDIKRRRFKGMGALAQEVQRSAYPDRYRNHIGLISDAFPRISRKGGNGGGGDINIGGQAGFTNLPQTFYPGIKPGTSPFQPLPTDTFDALRTSEDIYELGGDSTNGLLSTPYQPGMATPGTLEDGGIFDDFELFTTPLRPMKDPSEFSLIQGGYSKGVDGWRQAVIEAAKSVVGTPYVWGGTSPNGFDCSGLLVWAFGKAGINLPRVSYQQANSGKRIPLKKLKPGDLVAWDNSSRNNGADHIAIYIGNGKIIESPRRGLSVRIRTLSSNEGAWGVRMKG